MPVTMAAEANMKEAITYVTGNGYFDGCLRDIEGILAVFELTAPRSLSMMDCRSCEGGIGRIGESLREASTVGRLWWCWFGL